MINTERRRIKEKSSITFVKKTNRSYI